MQEFTLDTSISNVTTIGGVKYYYSKETATAYYLEKWGEVEALHGVPQWGENKFNTEEAFQVETWNEQLSAETFSDDEELTLGMVWNTAKRILKGNNVIVTRVHKPEVGDEYQYAVAVMIDCDGSNLEQGGSEMEWFKTEDEQREAYKKALETYGVEA